MRQGAVLSPSLFSLYINKLLVSLESSGLGCNIGNYFYGASAYADDIILLSPTRSGLQDMFDICFQYFKDHEITISTNPDPKKSKTKCIFFPYGKQQTSPTPLVMGDNFLPWVDHWPHLGKGNFTHDLLDKRAKFIGKFNGLMQEFGFAESSVIFSIVNIQSGR